MDSIMLIILPRPPSNDALWPPKASPPKGLVGLRHLAARPVGRDRGYCDAQIGSDVRGRPPFGIGIGPCHMTHRTASQPCPSISVQTHTVQVQTQFVCLALASIAVDIKGWKCRTL
jgi:hypothetical protein